jgi:hypothetical protein
MKPAIAPADYLPSIDDLDSAIVNLAARINAANYELLVLIRRFDERAGWLKEMGVPELRRLAALALRPEHRRSP